MKKVIIFGMGKFFREFENELFNTYDIIAIVDNFISEITEYRHGNMVVPVMSPSKINVLGHYPIVIMIRDFWDVYIQLLQMHVKDENILFGCSYFWKNERDRLIYSDGGFLQSRNGKIIFIENGDEKYINSQEEYFCFLQEQYKIQFRKKNPTIGAIVNMALEPISRNWGFERGRPIDRHYIDGFIEKHKDMIKGKVLEISDNYYTKKYGENRFNESVIMHVKGWGENVIEGNLETGVGVSENEFDTLILTQVLMFIYDTKAAVKNIYKILKSGGNALITVAGMSNVSRYDADNWGDYYSFHEDAIKRLFGEVFGEENIRIECFGNVKIATAFLYGLCCEDLTDEDFAFQDPDYQVIIGIAAHKK